MQQLSVSGKSPPKSVLLPPGTPRALGTLLLGIPVLAMLPARSLTRRIGIRWKCESKRDNCLGQLRKWTDVYSGHWPYPLFYSVPLNLMGICVLLLFYLLSLMCHESTEIQTLFCFWTDFIYFISFWVWTSDNLTTFDGNGQSLNIGNCHDNLSYPFTRSMWSKPSDALLLYTSSCIHLYCFRKLARKSFLPTGTPLARRMEYPVTRWKKKFGCPCLSAASLTVKWRVSVARALRRVSILSCIGVV